jgi:MOSC domain-containing protein YiiM
MFEGELFAIYVGAKKTRELDKVPTAEAVAGQGLAGDRYFHQDGTFTKKGSPDREVTLIELEAIEAAGTESAVTLEPGQARRNLVTRGVPLNHLVGKDFLVGNVRLHGIRLCEPCGHLERLTRPGVQEALCHRGGLRAQILEGGTLKAGDAIRPV